MDFSHISFYALSALVNFFASFFFGTFVYLQDRKNPVGKSFARFMWTIALWSILYAFFLQTQNVGYDTMMVISHIIVAPAIFISITAFHFITHFLGKAKKYRKITSFGYVIFTLFALLSLFGSPLFIETVRPISVFDYWAKGGILFHPFMVLWAAYFIAFFILLLTSYRESDRIKKAQIRYILLGTIFGNLGGSSGWILFYDIPIIPPIIVLSFLVLAYGYAILKHHLFSIRMFAVEVLTFIIWILLLIKIIVGSQAGQFVIFDIAIFLSVVVIGSFLIRTGVRESRQREMLAELNAELDYLNKNLKEKVAEQTKEIRKAYEVEKEAR
ncbi:MAG: histidine kinase N-terminal 7TM domain-containing protein, partial [Patescibacteria group bacterium]|nr:histidine kinase N-terminal 7TM domain-containing protein [bacterium]MDZ4240681.1 histidine kinase N-terminal 7TM domain-containing protein [Patescibacteria group bacterium]